MKKLLTLVVLLGFTTMAKGVDFRSASFSNCRSLIVSNTFSVTNLASQLALTRTTNMLGTEFTNNAGEHIVVTNGFINSSLNTTGGYYASFNLLKTLPLWGDSQGQSVTPVYTNSVLAPGPFFASIYIRVIGLSGANTATTFYFKPVPSGKEDSNVEDTVAGDMITISVTPNTTTMVCSLTPLDATKLVGVAGLRLCAILAGDTDATSSVTVLECSLNGFVP